MQLLDAASLLLQAYEIHAETFIPKAATVAASLHYSYVHAILGLLLLLGAPFLAGLLIERDPPKS